MLRKRKVKILATVGPETESLEQIEKLFIAGVDVFRLNFSHGSHQEHQKRVENIRIIEEKYHTPIAILGDLQGPKLRIGQFKNDQELLETGATFRLDLDDALGDQSRVQLPHPQIFESLTKGAELLVDDGKIKLTILDHGEGWATTRVDVGGYISDRKGVNVPGAILNISALTDKDRRDLDFALSIGVDWVALSFVQHPRDIEEARTIIQDKAAIISKLEKPSAIQYLDEIIALSDACMVARGDLGVEVPAEKVPSIQKRIVRSCRCQGKPVVIATQMLDSMIQAPTPTRAEASDVANAVYDGADAVMLSGETTVGKYPIKTVEIMSKIINDVEIDPYYKRLSSFHDSKPNMSIAGAIAAAASQMAETLESKIILSFTATGSTSINVANERPIPRIVSISPNVKTSRRLNLVWGVSPLTAQLKDRFQDVVAQGKDIVMEKGIVEKGDNIIITAGVPVGMPGSTNSIRVLEID